MTCLLSHGRLAKSTALDPATGLPVTPVFQGRYATTEDEYRTVNLPRSPIPNSQSSIPNRPPTSNPRLQAELLAGSRLDGTGGWKPLELGEIVTRWRELWREKAPLNRWLKM